ncbi:MAG: hypothetical protein IPH94_12795 [Saprospiraceae bacterium]|nr:hypothetical protein [Saprospiraceae bacterium]MBK8850202.1 hypothetical protein [Saprospiraceae bacterium]
MMVYKIECELNGMRELRPIKFDFEKQKNWFEGNPMSGIFNEKEEKFIAAQLKRKYMDFFNGASTLCLGTRAFEIIGPSMSKYGEFFKVEIMNLREPDKYAFLYNLTTILNPFHPSKSIWSFDYKGNKDRPIHFVFKKNKITTPLFSVPNGHIEYGIYWEPFCTDGLLPPEEEFYHIYQNSGLKGLRFKEIELT